MKGGESVHLFGAVGPQDQGQESLFPGRKLGLLLGLAQVRIDAHVVLALVFAEVQDFKGAVVPVVFLELALDPDEALARGVNGEFAQVRANPFAAQLFGHGRRGPGPAKKIRHQIAFVGRGFDDTFEQGFGFLG